jgi:uncharacterized protein
MHYPPVKTKEELIGRILLDKDKIASYGVERLGIFGSFVRDQVQENSDVDFFIHFQLEYKTLRNFIGLSNFLSELLGRKIEIVTPQSLNQFIGKYIQQEVEYISLAA